MRSIDFRAPLPPTIITFIYWYIYLFIVLCSATKCVIRAASFIFFIFWFTILKKEKKSVAIGALWKPGVQFSVNCKKGRKLKASSSGCLFGCTRSRSERVKSECLCYNPPPWPNDDARPRRKWIDHCVCVCRVGSVRAAEQQEVISPQSAARFRFILAGRAAGVELELQHTSTYTIPPPLLLADQNMKMVLSQRQREEL